jgi:hypothetical protein
MVLWLAACVFPFDGPSVAYRCASDDVALAGPDVGAFGVSPDDVAAWLGAEVRVDADWVGRHSHTPASDTFVVTVGPLVSAYESLGIVEPPLTDADCQDQLYATFEAQVATADGEVSGVGTLSVMFRESGTFQVPLDASALDVATLQVSAADVTLADARWAEAQVYVDASLSPPTAASLGLYHSEGFFDIATLQVSGDGYGMAIWSCDEQRHDDCAAWTLGGVP